MGKARIEKYIPKAMIAIDKNLSTDGKIPSVYKGYISSFGSSIVSGGLLATVAFYENNQANATEDRRKMTLALLEIISDGTTKEKSLFNYIRKQELSNELVDKVVDAVIALKLAMRTYKLV